MGDIALLGPWVTLVYKPDSFLFVCMRAKSLQLCLTLCDPVD